MTRLRDDLDQRRFDEFLMLAEADQIKGVEWLTPIIDEAKPVLRKSHHVEPFNRTVGLVVANALVAGIGGIHYSRRTKSYSGPSPYRPPWLGSTHLLGVIDGLAAAGLLETTKGQWAGTFSKGVESSFRATPALVDELKARGIELSSVQRDRASAPVIELKDASKRRTAYCVGDEWVVARTGELRAYNAFIEDQDIALRGRETPRFCGLTRIYNDGSWERGGRHYRGWWQSIPSSERSNILINGQETIELDFGGFMARALYHLAGNDFEGDPYDIPKIKSLFEEAGIDWEKGGRPVVKDAVNILLNISSRNAIYKMKDKFPDQGVPLSKVVSSIIDHHKPIEDYFFSVVSPKIMNVESDICNDIIMRGMADGVVILPIFDSFITAKRDDNYLKETMSSCYQRRLTFSPTIH